MPAKTLLTATILHVTRPVYHIRDVGNGKGPITFRLWYFDDIYGILAAEDEVARDSEQRIALIADWDEPARDDLKLDTTPRTEEPPDFL